MDLHYLTHLHDRHDDYPRAPESLVIDRSVYSSTQQAVFPESAPQRKLTHNLRNRVSVELITDARILRKRVAKPNFCRCNPITDCLTVVQCKVATLTLNRPIYVGFSVLELLKLDMYDFHYNHMCVQYPRANQLRLLFTDTDSLAYDVQTDDIYSDMVDDAASRYDFSEYPLDHPMPFSVG